jgi:uncharacterized membrane protein YkoI
MKLKINLLAIALFSSITVITPLVDVSVAADLILAESTQVEQAVITEDEAAVIAAKATSGKVISSETSGVEGVTVYRFRVLMSDGQVKIVQVKATTGELL